MRTDGTRSDQLVQSLNLAQQPATHTDPPSKVGSRREPERLKADKVHAPDGERAKAHGAQREQDVRANVAPNRARAPAEQEQRRIRSEDGDDDGCDDNARVGTDGERIVDIVCCKGGLVCGADGIGISTSLDCGLVGGFSPDQMLCGGNPMLGGSRLLGRSLACPG